ncbi:MULTISPECIES: YjdF family protein [Bacillus]|uniref:YjdF family protein n=1 Tax=Bacillus TaxID=1386 RepID=UPI0002E2FC16|nr:MULTISPECIES: YjdF family protein [Bacillus]
MKLTIYFDGQFYIGLIETISDQQYKVYRHVFGNEPKDQEVLDFVHNRLLSLLQKQEQEGISIQSEIQKKINPKRLQRSVSKELQQTSISTKAQEALKKEYEQKKAKLKHKGK